jgi:hypothetical protein
VFYSDWHPSFIFFTVSCSERVVIKSFSMPPRSSKTYHDHEDYDDGYNDYDYDDEDELDEPRYEGEAL